MAKRTTKKQDHLAARMEAVAKSEAIYSHVIACVDISPGSRKIIPHALAVAKALGGELTLGEIMETHAPGHDPIDPVEWDIQRREACERVKALAEEYGGGNIIATQVLEGEPAGQICDCAQENAADLIVLSTHGHGDIAEWDIGNTARRVMDTARGAVLLVPASTPQDRIVRYTRLMVPLDGSPYAESALPVAIGIARTYDAELFLVHAIPQPQITEIGPLESEDIVLCERLTNRNEKAACGYLDRIRTRVGDDKLSVRTLILSGGDARRLLARVVVDESIDLVVLSSHGHSGHADVPFGGVAAYLISHMDAPLLMVRNQLTAKTDRIFADVGPTGIRRPRRSAQ